MCGRELRELYASFKAVLDVREILIAEIDGEPVGFCLGASDYNSVLRRARGRQGPLTTARFILAVRRPTAANLWGIAVMPGHGGKRISQTLRATLYRYYEQRRGLRGSSYGLVNDDNAASRALAESFGGNGQIPHHHYDKRLD